MGKFGVFMAFMHLIVATVLDFMDKEVEEVGSWALFACFWMITAIYFKKK